VGQGDERPGGWDFFVSYTQADRAWAEWIAWLLEEDGYKVLVQAWDFVPGGNWIQSMHDGTRGAKRTVAVLSPDYLDSVFGGAEWRAAWAQDPAGAGRKLLVVRVAECDRPGLLAGVVSTDVFGLTEEQARARVRAMVAAAVTGRAKPAVAPRFPGGGRAVAREPRFPGASPPEQGVSAGAERSRAAQAGSVPEWALEEVTDPVALEVHRLARSGLSPVGRVVGGLPRRTVTFTGRDAELGQLLDLLDPVSGEAMLVQVSAVSGLGGVGKTELVLQAAHAARERGWFPGGVLFVNLFGYDPARRVAPGRALDGLLRALGVPKDDIPPGTQDRGRLYTSLLGAYATDGRPILVVIDNAWSAEQAEPLLPPAGAGRAVITSRHVLAELAARLIELKPLSTSDAVALLDRNSARPTALAIHARPARCWLVDLGIL
jgi:TIR domain/AAA ATPase domain